MGHEGENASTEEWRNTHILHSHIHTHKAFSDGVNGDIVVLRNNLAIGDARFE